MHIPMRVRSMVGLIPLFAAETFEPEEYGRLTGFCTRMQWFLDHNPDVREHVDMSRKSDYGPRLLLTIANRKKLERIYRYCIRRKRILIAPRHPRAFQIPRRESVRSTPRRSAPFRRLRARRIDRPIFSAATPTGAGPVWFPMNFLLIESLQRIHHYYGDEFKVECPVGSGKQLSLWQAAQRNFPPPQPYFSSPRWATSRVWRRCQLFQNDPHWRDLILFYEYFHGETGAGLGASHQTGWTALVAKLIEQSGE